MQHLINELTGTVERRSALLKDLPESEFSARPAPGKWSKKEIIGHLVDSAQNNIQRFVRAQHEMQPVHILYRQDDWVRLQNYQDYPSAGLLQIWVLLNRHLAHIWKQMAAQDWARTCRMGAVEALETWTLEMLAEDYVRHLKHHLAFTF